MTVLSTLTSASVSASAGISAGYSDWRFVVQVAKAPSDAVLGTMILGTDPLTEIGWSDITADVEGVLINRGAEAGSRPGAGQLNLRLRNDAGTYAPPNSTYFGPGTLIRVFLGSPGSAGQLFTGLTIEWNEYSDGVNRSRWIDVTALETISLLAEVNNPAITAAGAGESASLRIQRILTAANWQFGYAVDYDGAPYAAGPWWGYALQATTLASDLLTEAYLTADSVGLLVRSARNGDCLLCERALRTVANSNAIGTTVPVVADSIVTANDDDRILGSISLARVGGTAVTYTNSGVAGRYQTRSTQRYDLITQDPGSNADLAHFASVALTQGRWTYRVKSFGIDSGQGAASWGLLQALDLGVFCTITKPNSSTHGVTFTDLYVCGYELRIEPAKTSIHISATVETDVSPEAESTWSTY